MREGARWSMLIIGMAVTTLSLWAVPQSATVAAVWSGQSASTIDTSTPEPVAPETTEPDSTTATSEPDDPTSDTSMDDALVGAGEPDSDIDTTTAAVAVIGFVALLALASWWMVRRSDPDSTPMPPRPPSDLI